MNRRGFLWAVSATGLWLLLTRPVLLSAAPKKTAEETLRPAIAERRVVQFRYHGYARRVEPHGFVRVNDNRPALLGWQVSGGSASEPPPGWRTFVLADIRSLKLLQKTFTPRPDYRPETAGPSPVEAGIFQETKPALEK
jgi:predicted DNA-binding transcriptional regulator YafY